MSERFRSIRSLGWCALALSLATVPNSGFPADRQRSGREIFLQRCSKCHGHNGEGVRGKYDGPMQGSRPLDKLTRYIERNMPDDDPGTCVGEEAATVARY